MASREILIEFPFTVAQDVLKFRYMRFSLDII